MTHDPSHDPGNISPRGMRLRQVAWLAADLASAEEELCAVLGLVVSYRDPVVAQWGLENAVLPIGDDFLEIVSPVAAGTSAGRYLERRGGDGGYMVILHCADARAERERITALGVRAVHVSEGGEARGSHFHPRDLGGVLLSIHSVAGHSGAAGHAEAGAPWPYAGENWQNAVRTEVVSGLAAVEIQGEHPLEMAENWARVLDLPLGDGENGGAVIPMSNGDIRFVPISDSRGVGVSAIDVRVTDRARLLAEAQKRGLEAAEDHLYLRGLRINLV